jgi:hypothetical protein
VKAKKNTTIIDLINPEFHYTKCSACRNVKKHHSYEANGAARRMTFTKTLTETEEAAEDTEAGKFLDE